MHLAPKDFHTDNPLKKQRKNDLNNNALTYWDQLWNLRLLFIVYFLWNLRTFIVYSFIRTNTLLRLIFEWMSSLGLSCRMSSLGLSCRIVHNVTKIAKTIYKQQGRMVGAGELLPPFDTNRSARSSGPQ